MLEPTTFNDDHSAAIRPTPEPFAAEISQGRIGPAQAASGPAPGSEGKPAALSIMEETTLDEPVKDTILRDLRMILDKMKKVILLPGDAKDVLRNWSAVTQPAHQCTYFWFLFRSRQTVARQSEPSAVS